MKLGGDSTFGFDDGACSAFPWCSRSPYINALLMLLDMYYRSAMSFEAAWNIARPGLAGTVVRSRHLVSGAIPE